MTLKDSDHQDDYYVLVEQESKSRLASAQGNKRAGMGELVEEKEKQRGASGREV